MSENPNLQVHRGALYATRPNQPRRAPRHRAPDEVFSRRVQGIAATWKSDGGQGAYPSRAVANTAHGFQFPLRHLDRQMRDAVDGDVPIERILEMGRAVIERARELWARARKTLPAA